MSFDHTTQEYHLTLSGWITGSFLVYGEGKKIEPPTDRIETWVIDTFQSSGFAAETVTEELIWKSPDYSESQREALRYKFPPPPITKIQQVYYGKGKKRKQPKYGESQHS